jgi:hypothetical protein
MIAACPVRRVHVGRQHDLASVYDVEIADAHREYFV